MPSIMTQQVLRWDPGITHTKGHFKNMQQEIYISRPRRMRVDSLTLPEHALMTSYLDDTGRRRVSGETGSEEGRVRQPIRNGHHAFSQSEAAGENCEMTLQVYVAFGGIVAVNV